MWYLILRRPVKPRDQWTVSLDRHLVWMKQQHEAGKILFSGPTADRKFGIYVIRAASKEEAETIAGADPYTAAGFCAFDIFEWEVHQILGVGAFTAAELQGHRKG
ncbi:MAG TPA: YciI family protein [Candidatus Binatia bacterium]|nr:YciI family protein [Candidatus Binatia bacterium]